MRSTSYYTIIIIFYYYYSYKYYYHYRWNKTSSDIEYRLDFSKTNAIIKERDKDSKPISSIAIASGGNNSPTANNISNISLTLSMTISEYQSNNASNKHNIHNHSHIHRKNAYNSSDINSVINLYNIY